MASQQRGGFVMGLIVGLLIGLALALGVALYVTKVPVPFVNKVPQRTAEQDAAEAEQNKNWDPNAPLRRQDADAARPSQRPVPPGARRRCRLAATGDRRSGATHGAAPRRPGARSPPTGPRRDRRRRPRPPKPGADPFTYFVQAGAFAEPRTPSSNAPGWRCWASPPK